MEQCIIKCQCAVNYSLHAGTDCKVPKQLLMSVQLCVSFYAPMLNVLATPSLNKIVHINASGESWKKL